MCDTRQLGCLSVDYRRASRRVAAGARLQASAQLRLGERLCSLERLRDVGRVARRALRAVGLAAALAPARAERGVDPLLCVDRAAVWGGGERAAVLPAPSTSRGTPTRAAPAAVAAASTTFASA